MGREFKEQVDRVVEWEWAWVIGYVMAVLVGRKT